MQFLLVVVEIFHLKGNVLPGILSVVLDILIAARVTDRRFNQRKSHAYAAL